MGRDLTDRIVLRVEPAGGPPERLVFEPRSDGRWTRREETWTGCRWRTRGTDVVASVAIEAADAVTAD